MCQVPCSILIAQNLLRHSLSLFQALSLNRGARVTHKCLLGLVDKLQRTSEEDSHE